MNHLKPFLVSASFFLLGIGAGLGFLYVVPHLPLGRSHALYKSLRIIKPHIIGFQPYWLFSKADKDYTSYLTDFTYFGLILNIDGTILKKVNPQEEEPGWTRLKSNDLKVALEKAEQANLTRSLLIQNSNPASLSALLKNPELHAQNLISEVTPIMREYRFTDLNLDLESFREASPEAQQRFTTFTREVKKGLDEQQLGTLTVEVTPISLIRPHLTQASEIGEIADRVVVMAYDYHYRDSFTAGPVAPINGGGEVREFDVEITIQEALKQIPAKKIILGLPLYGYEWDTITNQPGAAVVPGSGKTATHRRVEEVLTACPDCIQGFDELSLQPFVISPQKPTGYYAQTFYENEVSLEKKLALAQKYDLGGVALWALGYEGNTFLSPLKEYRASYKRK